MVVSLLEHLFPLLEQLKAATYLAVLLGFEHISSIIFENPKTINEAMLYFWPF